MPLTPADKLSERADLCWDLFGKLIVEDGAKWNTYSFMEKVHKRRTHLKILNQIRMLDRLRTRFWQRENRIINYN